MKKINLLIMALLLPLLGFSQLAEENFEGAWATGTTPNQGPPGWKVFDNGVGLGQKWIQAVHSGTTPSYEGTPGTKSAHINRENVLTGVADDYLVTPLFPVPEAGELTFYSRLTIPLDQGGKYSIRIVNVSDNPAIDVNSPASYTTIQEWGEFDINPVQTEYNKIVLELPEEYWGDDVRIAFVMSADFQDRWLIDKVKVAARCVAPENVAAGSITLNSAAITWDSTAGAGNFEIEIVKEEDVPTGTGFAYNGTLPYNATGLEEDTCYKFYIRSLCNDGGISNWPEPLRFCTWGYGDRCDIPLTITSLPFTDTDDTANYANFYSGHTGTGCNTEEFEEYLSGHDVVYAYTADFSGMINVDLFNNGSHSGMFVYDSCENIGQECLAGNKTGVIASAIEINEFPVTNGTTYYIVISTSLEQTTPYSLLIQKVNCSEPVGLPTTDIGMTSATLSWTNPSGAASWQIVLQEKDGGLPAGAGQTTNNNTNFSTADMITLTPATEYEYYVRADCANGTFSSWAGPYFFNTTVCPVSEQCNYTFILTSLWGGWSEGTMQVKQGGVPIATLGIDFIDTEDKTREVTVPVCSNMPIELYWNKPGFAADGMGIIIKNPFNQTIFTKTADEGSPFTTLYTGMVDCNSLACVPPAELTASNAGMTTVDIGWDGPANGNWEYYITVAGNAPPTATTDGTPTNTNPTLNAGPLNAATNYEYYVRLVCDTATGIKSEWAGPYKFNTEVCLPEEKCTFYIELTNAYGQGYVSGTMQIMQAGVPITEVGSTFTWESPDPYKQIIGVPLCPNKEIEIIWNNGGDNPDALGFTVYSPYMETIYSKPAGTGEPETSLFTGLVSCEAPACLKPQNLNAGAFTMISSELSWEEMGSADSWEIAVLPHGSEAPAGNGATVNALPYTATQLLTGEPLSAGNAYVFYVRANCGGDGMSTWAGPYAFITLLSNDDCLGAIDVPVNNGIECLQSVKGLFTGATPSGLKSGCEDPEAEPSKDIWYKFVAEAETHVALLTYDTAIMNISSALYSGDNCSSLTQMLCEGVNQTILGNLTIGETYYLRIFSFYTANDSFVMPTEICIYTPNPIKVANNSAEDIVKNVLIPVECVEVSNITSRTGTDFPGTRPAGVNGIAYFHKGDSSFPLEEGLLLSTGEALKAVGPNVTNLSEEGDVNQENGEVAWPGDDQLLNYINDLGIDPAMTTYKNATVVEFDFVALSNRIKFPFVFASEEYGDFQCNFSDAFAFFLTGPEGTKNLALVPGTEAPVSVITIRDGAHSPDLVCGSSNEDFFDNFYGLDEPGVGNGLDPKLAPINFDGHTVQMFAQSEVTPGATYHIRLVIADREDGMMDSAVFIGKFDIGSIDLGPDLTEANGNAICHGKQVTLSTGLTSNEHTYEWLIDRGSGPEVIPGANQPTLVVTEGGTYTVNAQYSPLCKTSDSIVVEFYKPVEDVTGNPGNITECTPTGIATFDFSANTEAIISGAAHNNYTVTYHLTADEAEAGTAALPLLYQNTAANQEIYVRIVNNATGCIGYKGFQLIAEGLDAAISIKEYCSDNKYMLEVLFEEGTLNAGNANITWQDENNNIIGSSPTLVISAPGSYRVTVSPEDSEDCTLTEEIGIASTLCYIPRGISPNGDGKNDVFDLSSFNVKQLTILNRYGQKLYAKSNYKNEWSGQDSNGNGLPTGTYFYMIEYANGENTTGWVYINRQE